MNSLLICVLALSQPPQFSTNDQFGYLWPVYGDKIKQMKEIPRGAQPMPYRPAEGDLTFYTSRKPSFRVLYTLARSGQPYHVGIVVRTSAGELRLFEVGTDIETDTSLFTFQQRFGQHQRESNAGVIWIRRLRQPLTPEQSYALTHFAESQEGTRFAWVRTVLLGTPVLTARGPLGRLRPETRPRQLSWFCSEQVVEALMMIGMIREDVRSNAIMPRDLFLDKRVDLRCGWHDPMRWTCRPCPVPPEDSPKDIGPSKCPICR